MANTQSENSCPVPKGILVIIGGKEDKQTAVEKDEEQKQEDGPEILKSFLHLLDKDDPTVEIITSAAGEAEETFEDYRKIFEELKTSRLGHIHHNTRKELLEDDLEERINQADAFFFTGGDQLLLTSIYGGTHFLTRMKERYIDEAVVIAGTSAGAMAMSTPMIFAGNKSVQQISGQIKITTGLEFLKDVCIDTHFIDRSRFVRMAHVLATNPTCIGIGIEENTAIIVRQGIKVEVIGSGVVTVVEGFAISDSNMDEFSEDRPVFIEHLLVHLLSRGRSYEIPQMNPPHK